MFLKNAFYVCNLQQCQITLYADFIELLTIYILRFLYKRFT